MVRVDLDEALRSAGLSAPARWDDVTGSTNETAAAWAAEGAPAWSLVGAGHQTRGRGRLDRAWIDRPGQALMVSVVLRPGIPAAEAGVLTLLAGAAWAEAAGEVAGAVVRCKWPNDLLAGGAKVGGILAASSVDAAGDLVWVVLGSGVNLSAPPDVPGAAGLGAEVDPTRLLGAFLRSFREGYRPAERGWERAALDRWRAVADTPGRRVLARRAGRPPVAGVALGVDARGALVIRGDHGEEEAVTAAEVEHLD